MCYNVVPLANDLMYIYDMGRNDHRKKGAWDIYFSNLNVYMHYINKGLLMLSKPTSDTYQLAI